MGDTFLFLFLSSCAFSTEGVKRCDSFSVESVMSTCRANVPFMATHHLHNQWNENRKVQVSRDGQVSAGSDRLLLNSSAGALIFCDCLW